MRILVAAISFSSKMSGIQRHAFNLVRCLLAHPDISEVHLAVAPWQQDLAFDGDSRLKIHIASVKSNPLSRNLWHYNGLAKLARRLQPHCIHLSFPVPFNSEMLGCPVVLTLHDLYPYEIPANFHFPHVLLNRAVLQQSLRRADAIACVSDTTLARLSQHAPEHVSRRAIRIYNCVERLSCEPASKPLAELQSPFLLCVAQHRRNKNIPLLIRAFRSLLGRRIIVPETNLLVVGIPGPETARLYSLVAELNLTRRVLFADGLPDASLQWCYTHCDALIVPSITEGFGLPVAEALIAGCRVICSDIPALRELGGPNPHYFSLGEREEENLIAALTAAMIMPKPQPISLPCLSVQVLAQQYVSLYRSVREQHYAKASSSADQTNLRSNSALREI